MIYRQQRQQRVNHENSRNKFEKLSYETFKRVCY